MLGGGVDAATTACLPRYAYLERISGSGQVWAQPACKHLCEGFHRAGTVPAVMGELLQAG